jgi:methylase of polypeptide subunit release factors
LAKDIFGQALCDHFKTGKTAKLFINNKYGPKEEMPLDVYFRTEEDMPDLELLALSKCRGRVLDIGAGAGSHALYCSKAGIDVTAMDISGRAVHIMLERGVKQALSRIYTLTAGEKYDTFYY